MHSLHQCKSFATFFITHSSKVRRSNILLYESYLCFVCRHIKTTKVLELCAHMGGFDTSNFNPSSDL